MVIAKKDPDCSLRGRVRPRENAHTERRKIGQGERGRGEADLAERASLNTLQSSQRAESFQKRKGGEEVRGHSEKKG